MKPLAFAADAGELIKTQNLVAEKIAVPRTRGSVRRANGFVQVAISLTTPQLV
jgi:hypothetical protein